jgi:hypothetical protein
MIIVVVMIIVSVVAGVLGSYTCLVLASAWNGRGSSCDEVDRSTLVIVSNVNLELSSDKSTNLIQRSIISGLDNLNDTLLPNQ